MTIEQLTYSDESSDLEGTARSMKLSLEQDTRAQLGGPIKSSRRRADGLCSA